MIAGGLVVWGGTGIQQSGDEERCQESLDMLHTHPQEVNV